MCGRRKQVESGRKVKRTRRKVKPRKIARVAVGLADPLSATDAGRSSAHRARMQKQCHKLQLLVHDCLAKHLYGSAIFFADKLTSLSECAPADVFTLAQAFYMDKQYRRALTLLRGTDLVEQDVRFRYLAAKCLVECQEWEECLKMVGGWEDDSLDSIDMQEHQNAAASGQQISYYSAFSLLRGKIYDALENHGRAVKWYQAALKADPFCYEAFQILIDNHMLTADEEAKLRSSLKFSQDDHWLALLYQAKCKKYDQQSSIEDILQELERPVADGSQSPVEQDSNNSTLPSMPLTAYDHSRNSTAIPMQSPADVNMATPNSESHGPAANQPGCGLGDNIDVLVCRAQWYYHVGAYQECYSLTSSVLEQDPYAIEVHPVHITASLELGKKNELFRRAHKLVEEYPDRALSWFAVGCYYLCTHQHDKARRHFGKATSMENNFAAAWIGFGNAFAFQDESDQAMAAYRTAARLFPGLHLPLTGMGMEYQRMNNLHLAEQMFHQAHKVCPSDPLACNELGVLMYRNHQYVPAERWLLRALELVPGRLHAGWEPVVVNLGHCYRKQQRWGEAMQVYERALGLCPGQASTYAALGFTKHLQASSFLSMFCNVPSGCADMINHCTNDAETARFALLPEDFSTNVHGDMFDGDLQQAIGDYHKALGLRPEDTFTAEMLAIALQDEAIPEDLEGDDVFG